MDDNDAEQRLHEAAFGRRKPREMSRGRQTAILIVAMIVIVFVALQWIESQDVSDPYAKCRTMFAADDCHRQVTRQLVR